MKFIESRIAAQVLTPGSSPNEIEPQSLVICLCVSVSLMYWVEVESIPMVRSLRAGKTEMADKVRVGWTAQRLNTEKSI